MLLLTGTFGSIARLIRERCAAFLGGREHNAHIRQGEAAIRTNIGGMR